MQLLTHGNTDAFVASLRQTAEAGDRVSMFWLGRSLEDVKGVPHDYAQAQQWYRMAADKGLGVAAWSLGRLFELGRGTAPDFDAAQKWYRKADELGFRRTALTMIQIRWVPGSQELEYQSVPRDLRNPQAQAPPGLGPVAPDLNAAELEILRKSGVRGRLVGQGSTPGTFGISARLILIAQKQVNAEVRLPLPRDGFLIYIQENDGWQRLGTGRLTDRNLRIQPQSPETPWITSITVGLEDGGEQTTSGWVWNRL